MSTATSLSVRALLSSAIARLGLGGRATALDGLTPPAKALAVAALAHASREAVVLYVVPGDPDLETATARHPILPRRARSPARRGRRASGAAVPLVSGRSLSRAGAALPRRFGACAGAARRRPGLRARRRGIGAGADAAARGARIDACDVGRSSAGSRNRAAGARRDSRRWRLRAAGSGRRAR